MKVIAEFFREIPAEILLSICSFAYAFLDLQLTVKSVRVILGDLVFWCYIFFFCLANTLIFYFVQGHVSDVAALQKMPEQGRTILCIFIAAFASNIVLQNLRFKFGDVELVNLGDNIWKLKDKLVQRLLDRVTSEQRSADLAVAAEIILRLQCYSKREQAKVMTDHYRRLRTFEGEKSPSEEELANEFASMEGVAFVGNLVNRCVKLDRGAAKDLCGTLPPAKTRMATEPIPIELISAPVPDQRGVDQA